MVHLIVGDSWLLNSMVIEKQIALIRGDLLSKFEIFKSRCFEDDSAIPKRVRMELYLNQS